MKDVAENKIQCKALCSAGKISDTKGKRKLLGFALI